MKPVDYFTRGTFINDDALFLEWLDEMFLMVSEEKEDFELFESNRMMQIRASVRGGNYPRGGQSARAS